MFFSYYTVMYMQLESSKTYRYNDIKYIAV